MAKVKKSVKKSAAKEALGSPAMSSKTVLFVPPAPSRKTVTRAASKIKKVRAARRALLETLDREEVAVLADDMAVVAASVVREAPPAVMPVKHVKTPLVVLPAVKKCEAPRTGIVNAICFWAGSVLSDSNAFLRLKKAN